MSGQGASRKVGARTHLYSRSFFLGSQASLSLSPPFLTQFRRPLARIFPSPVFSSFVDTEIVGFCRQTRDSFAELTLMITNDQSSIHFSFARALTLEIYIYFFP